MGYTNYENKAHFNIFTPITNISHHHRFLIEGGDILNSVSSCTGIDMAISVAVPVNIVVATAALDVSTAIAMIIAIAITTGSWRGP